jgi:hypothetical protein
MKSISIIAGLLCISAQAQPSSTYFSAQELYRRMTTDTATALVHGYIAGVHDAQSGITICIPPATVSLGQMLDMVKQAMERVPSERHLPADIFVEAALSSRWPCSKKGTGI